MDSERSTHTRLRLALAAADNPVVVDTQQKLEQAARSWQNQAVLGLDTEFLRERTYRADLGLVQISDGETAWLVDPLAIKDLTVLHQLLQDPAVSKVIHSGSEDLEVIHHQLEVQPAAVLDSQMACAMLGQSLQLGYHHAVKWLFDVEIDKDHTRSNWLRRPLSAGQLRYAALDVVLLPEMMVQLKLELDRLGRWSWLLEEVARMQRKSIENTPPERAWKRIRGAGSLDDTQRTTLRVLAAWREQVAAQKNLAKGFVVPDAALIAMARTLPESMAELSAIKEIHPKAAQRYGEVWLDLMTDASASAPVDPLFELSAKQRKWLKVMRTRVSEVASRLDVDAALLASRKQLERLIASYVTRGEIPERFNGWRFEIVTKDLLQVMQQ